ncbi:MAG: hypothetical protein J0I91_00045 [Candidatus Accumulibacter sp.]|nr:hypothetical protein [Accumulibacter sp.]
MATITSLGSGSGLPLESLVTSLMAVERRPLTSIKNQSSAATAKISAFGALSSKLAALQTAAKGLMPSATQTALDKFASYTGTVKDTAIASASVSTGAVAGNYALKVSQLAGGQNLLSNAFVGGASALAMRHRPFIMSRFTGRISRKKAYINCAEVTQHRAASLMRGFGSCARLLRLSQSSLKNANPCDAGFAPQQEGQDDGGI